MRNLYELSGMMDGRDDGVPSSPQFGFVVCCWCCSQEQVDEGIDIRAAERALRAGYYRNRPIRRRCGRHRRRSVGRRMRRLGTPDAEGDMSARQAHDRPLLLEAGDAEAALL